MFELIDGCISRGSIKNFYATADIFTASNNLCVLQEALCLVTKCLIARAII